LGRATLVKADETKDQTLTILIGEDELLEYYAKVTTATDFAIDFATSDGVWFDDVITATGVTEFKGTIWCCWWFARLRIKKAGTAGDVVDAALLSKGFRRRE